MTNSDFTLELALSLSQAKDEYPVDFNQAWQWLGYSRKDHAKSKFLSCGFIENVDYRLLRIRETTNHGTFSHVWEQITLTVDCFKMWGMMAGTDKGKEVRFYFLDCEKIAKEKEAQKSQELQEFIQTHARIYNPEYSKEFYNELYRVTGCSRPKRGQNPFTSYLVHEFVYAMFGQDVLDEINRVNPVIGYYTYEREKATPEELKALKAKIAGQKSAVTMYTKSDKLSKAKKAQRRVDRLVAEYKRLEKPHTTKLAKRALMNHQFCSDFVGLPSLQAHLHSMVQIMRTLPADDFERFKDAMQKAFPEGAEKNVNRLILDIPKLAN